MSYDPQNIFAKILRGEIPCTKVYENGSALAFKDIHPQAPTHILVIPKGPYVNYADFINSASNQEITEFHKAIAQVITETGLMIDGYRLISNTGPNGHQEVPHYHVHILGGADLGPMLSR